METLDQKVFFRNVWLFGNRSTFNPKNASIGVVFYANPMKLPIVTQKNVHFLKKILPSRIFYASPLRYLIWFFLFSESMLPEIKRGINLKEIVVKWKQLSTINTDKGWRCLDFQNYNSSSTNADKRKTTNEQFDMKILFLCNQRMYMLNIYYTT